jgi:hypothetical protein
MSLFAPRTEGEGKFQYCNYGYDKTKYTSFEDCMAKYGKDTTIKDESKVETILGNGLTNGQKMTWVIGLTLAAWGLIYWSQKQANK